MILIDTGPLVALSNPADGDHLWCVRVLAGISEPITTTVPNLTEAFHLLSRTTMPGLREFINRSGFQIGFLDIDLIDRAFDLMAEYADRPMDFADAALVAVAERLNTGKIFTLDRNDFSTYRIRRGHRYVPFEILT